MKILLVLLLALSCHSFIIDEHNYLYLNSSYSRETISFSFCFRFHKPTVVVIQSAALIPAGDHKTVATFDGSNAIKFDPPFKSESDWYNTNDDGEYWFGIKKHHPTTANFQKITLLIQQQSKQLKYSFLLSLFRMPISGLLVYPVNTLYSCGNQLLVSYLYSYSQLDLYLFGSTKDVKFSAQGKKNWGFTEKKENMSYLRHKSKYSSQASITGIQSQNIYKCVINADTLLPNDLTFEQSKSSFTLQELLKGKAVSLSAEVTSLLNDL